MDAAYGLWMRCDTMTKTEIFRTHSCLFCQSVLHIKKNTRTLEI